MSDTLHWSRKQEPWAKRVKSRRDGRIIASSIGIFLVKSDCLSDDIRSLLFWILASSLDTSDKKLSIDQSKL